jgi:nitrite reductase/ring-hydroxylating ferredoxin subunit
MEAHRICRLNDLPPGRHVIADINGRRVAIINHEGRLHAIRNRCAHQGGPLGEGPVTRALVATEASSWELDVACEVRAVRCPWHGLEYNLETGRAIGDPRYRVKVYETRVSDGYIEVFA